MDQSNSSVRNISDTARWVAYFRARETQRPDALFRDPFAERLAGERGFEIANTLAQATSMNGPGWRARICSTSFSPAKFRKDRIWW